MKFFENVLSSLVVRTSPSRWWERDYDSTSRGIFMQAIQCADHHKSDWLSSRFLSLKHIECQLVLLSYSCVLLKPFWTLHALLPDQILVYISSSLSSLRKLSFYFHKPTSFTISFGVKVGTTRTTVNTLIGNCVILMTAPPTASGPILISGRCAS